MLFKIYLIIVPIIACILIIINLLISKNNNYIEKDGPFECGFTSYQQSRSSFNVSFILIAILFLPFDLEISSILPYVISTYNNNIYGLIIVILFLFILFLTFIFEFKLNALKLNKIYKNKYNAHLTEMDNKQPLGLTSLQKYLYK